MRIEVIAENKSDFLELLRLADEEKMIERYLERGVLFALYDGGLKSACVVTREGGGLCEIQNLATWPAHQRKGYASALVEHIFHYYKEECKTMVVGTGDSPRTILFYEYCGFTVSHRVKDYFPLHYESPVLENGVQLFDKVYLKKEL